MPEDEYLGYLLVRTHKSDTKRMTKIVGDFEITPSQFGVLQRLYKEDGLPAYKLVERLYSDSSTIMAILNRLEEKGLVRREGEPTDHRVNCIFLTRKSKKIMPELVARVVAFNKDMESALLPKEVQILRACLTKLYLHNMRKMEISENT